MKKLITILTISAILGMAGLAFAQEKAPECCKLKRDFTDINSHCTKDAIVGSGGYCPFGTPTVVDEWAACCLFNTVYTIAFWIMSALITIGILFGIWGGWMIMTSGGDPGKVEKGRGLIMYAILGIVIGALARSIPAIVKLLMK